MPQQGNSKKFAVLLDADGCIYNHIYFYLFYYLIANHGSLIFKEAKKLEFMNEIKNEDKLELRRKLKGVRQDLARFLAEDDQAIPAEAQLISTILSQHGYKPREYYTSRQVSKIINQTLQHYRDYILMLQQEGDEILADLLWIANQSLANEITKQLQGASYSEVIFISSSHRQSYQVELANLLASGVGLFCADLVLLVRKFTQKLRTQFPGIKVTLDKFLLADVYGGLGLGESFSRAITEDLKMAMLDKTLLERHADYVFDHTKFSLFYAIIHYLATKYADATVVINSFEDREDINALLARIFHLHPDLIAKNIELRFYAYSGDNLSEKNLIAAKAVFDGNKEILHLHGCGRLDYSYLENVKRIPILCGQSSIRYHESINSCEQLNLPLFKMYCAGIPVEKPLTEELLVEPC